VPIHDKVGMVGKLIVGKGRRAEGAGTGTVAESKTYKALAS